MSDGTQIQPNERFIDCAVKDFSPNQSSDDAIPKNSNLSKNLHLHLLEWGNDAKKPLILLHGLASTCHMFDLVAPLLAAHFHVYAPDQRGHGLSDKPSDGYDFETIAADLDALLSSLGISEPIMLAGHSWGANTALYYSATRPSKVERIVLIDGGIRRIADRFPTWEEAEIGMAPPVYEHRSQTDIEELIREKWLGKAYRPELLPLVLSIYDTSDPNNVHARLSRENHLQIAHALWAFNPTDYYSRVTCPTLIIKAIPPEQDITPQDADYARQAESLIPNAKIVWMRETIHDIPWQRPQELAEILISWL